MPLLSEMLRDDPRLQSCLTNNASHLVEGTVGPHVRRVQTALLFLDGLQVDRAEERSQRYGPSTAAAVLDFKTRRRIINFSYQTRPDNIVGKMTIAALDQELLKKEKQPAPKRPSYCGDDPRVAAQTLGRSEQASTRRFVPVTLTAATVGAGPSSVSTGSGISPAAVAKTRAVAGITAVNLTLGKLALMIHFRQNPAPPPVNPGLLQNFDALWRNFGAPIFPMNDPLLSNPVNAAVKTVDDYLTVVDTVLKRLRNNLGQAATLFHDVPKPQFPEAHAFTLGPTRKDGEPPNSPLFPDGVYFNLRYLTDGTNTVGPKKQMEVAVHECGHFVQNDNISDPAVQTLSSAYGYSNFVLFCVFGKETLADTE